MRARLRTISRIAALAIVVAAATVRPILAGDSIQSKQHEIESTRKQLESRRGLLQFQSVRFRDLRRQADETSASIASASRRLGDIDLQIVRNERSLARNRVALDAAEATLARHNDALRRRLVDAYERGDLGYVNVILSSTSFSDFVERWEDIRYLIVANERTVRERRSAERAVASARTDLERRELAMRDVRVREEDTKRQLASLADQRAQLVRAADLARRSAATQVAELENLSAAQEAALEQLIRERQKAEEARAAAEAAERRRAAQLSGQAVPVEAPVGAPGTFSWPASGPITSPFGMRADPFGHGFKMHSGVDIGAPMGSTITAAASGHVIFAGWYGGYGNAIIIDHGGRTSSLYGHCSQVFVSQGQAVERGQAIGAVGSTGESTGPHLHFEIRENGVPVEPTSRLR